jgi:hypothetical protein
LLVKISQLDFNLIINSFLKKITIPKAIGS